MLLVNYSNTKLQMVFTDLRSAPRFLPFFCLERDEKNSKEERKKDRMEEQSLRRNCFRNENADHLSRWTEQKASRRGVM